jgi:hypothetical protein
MSSKGLKTRFDSQFTRINGQMFSWGAAWSKDEELFNMREILH